MGMIVTAHGFDFALDTMDWSDQSARDQAESLLENYIQEWTPEFAKTSHSLMTAAVNGDVEWHHPQLAMIESRCGSIALEVTKDWARHPSTGHNCSISAA